ncbi:SDR family NAD(P)-dependent oxidoreductase [Paenibacillus sp. 1011MAR3C5]|uniref:SDR family NAD(P)-dependent oxidoreductase n=1 Tax=Paenibacillus sp. 1011MAR3C5 TaxID=1675787 RepID=UPI000E6D3FD7|nr:SDR family NAD(P)-dependent oxidoreductase [Paenibacillus sp. 1011MAR3C5]RJE91098.1 SDR family NAD(P)-dependent oxidoreductase [Paenibacillus sp. 1011MAR3C5]
MTILVTGATGTIGRHVVEQLVNKGMRVRAVTRNPEKAQLPEGAEAVAGDLTKADTLREALIGVTGIHLIASSYDSYMPWNTDPALIRLAEEAGVQRVSLLMSYEEGPLEEALKASSLEWTILMPVEFMSNALIDWQPSIQAEGVVREPFGSVRSARIHEGDIAAVSVAALVNGGHHGQSYYLTGPEALSRVEAVNVIAEATGKDIRFEELSEEEARQRWSEQGYDEESIAFFVQMGKNPPEIGYTVLPTVEQVTSKPARTFAEWVLEHKDRFT